MVFNSRFGKIGCFLVVTSLLVSCGGGGDSPPTPAPINTAPTITSSGTASLVEGTRVASRLTGFDAENDALSFSVTGGPDAALFTVDASNSLVFSVAPNFELPLGQDCDQLYSVEVTVSDGRLTSSQTVTVTVVDDTLEEGALGEPLCFTDVNHILQIGQSLSIGVGGRPVIHTEPFNDAFLTFANGPKALPVEAGGAPDETQSFKPLVEDSFSPDGGPSRGETGVWVAGNTLGQSISDKYGNASIRGKFLFTTAGFGGQPLSFFAKDEDLGSWWQQRFLASIRAAKAVAEASGESYSIPAIIWIQGEADRSRADYKDALAQLFDDITEAVLAETGQDYAPRFLTYVTAANTLESSPSTVGRVSTFGQVALARDRSDVFLGPVLYDFPHTPGGLHLTAPGYAMMGRVFGEQLASLFDDGVEPPSLIFSEATFGATRDTVRISFATVGGTLVFDEQNQARLMDRGFRIVDEMGEVPILTSSIEGEDTVVITTQRVVGNRGEIRYAVDYRLPSGPVNLTGGAGNLRLSRTLAVPDVASDAFFWAHPFIEPIIDTSAP